MTENAVTSIEKVRENMKIRYSTYSRELFELTRKHSLKEKLHGRKTKKPRPCRV